MANALPPSVPADLLVSRLAHQTLLHRALRLPQTSLFLASLLYSLLLATPNNLTGRLLYAAALLDAGAPHSALHLVKASALAEGDLRLAEVGARACDQLGRNREGRELLERTLERREERLSSSDGVAAIDEGEQAETGPRPGATCFRALAHTRRYPSNPCLFVPSLGRVRIRPFASPGAYARRAAIVDPMPPRQARHQRQRASQGRRALPRGS